MSARKETMTYVMSESMPSKFIQKRPVHRLRKRETKTRVQKFTFYSDYDSASASSSSQLSRKSNSKRSTVSSPALVKAVISSNVVYTTDVVEDSDVETGNELVGLEAIHKRISESITRSPELPIIESASNTGNASNQVILPVPDDLSAPDDLHEDVLSGQGTVHSDPLSSEKTRSMTDADHQETLDVQKENVSSMKKTRLRPSVSGRTTRRLLDKSDMNTSNDESIAKSGKRRDSGQRRASGQRRVSGQHKSSGRTVNKSAIKVVATRTPCHRHDDVAKRTQPIRPTSVQHQSKSNIMSSNGTTETERDTSSPHTSKSVTHSKTSGSWLSSRKSYKRTSLSRGENLRASNHSACSKRTSVSQVQEDHNSATERALDVTDFVTSSQNSVVAHAVARPGIRQQKTVRHKPDVRLWAEPGESKRSAARITNFDIILNFLDEAVSEARNERTTPAINQCMANFTDKMRASLRKTMNTAQRLARLKSAIYKVRRDIRSSRKRLLDMKVEQKQLEVEFCELRKRHRATCGKMKTTNEIGEFLSQLADFYGKFPPPSNNENCQVFNSEPCNGAFDDQIRTINREMIQWMQDNK